MARYRVLFSDVMDKTVHGELPLESFRFSDVLNAPGSFTGTMALDPEDGPVRIVTPETLAPWRTAVWVERDGSLTWGGPVKATDADVESNALTIDALGWHGYFRRRFVRHSRKYGAAYAAAIQDQTLIVKDLIDYAQSQTGGNVGVLTTGVQPSGKLRDLALPAWERTNVGEQIERTAALSGGFHFRYRPEWHPGTGQPRVYFETTYPIESRLTDYVFELGVNVELLSLHTDGEDMASLVDAMGAGEGSAKLIETRQDPALQGIVPLLEWVAAHTTVSRRSTLAAHAARRLRLGKVPVQVPQLQVHGGTLPDFGSYLVGEVIRVRGSHGYLSLNGLFRITSIDVAVDDNGGESIRIALAPVEVFE